MVFAARAALVLRARMAPAARTRSTGAGVIAAVVARAARPMPARVTGAAPALARASPVPAVLAPPSSAGLAAASALAAAVVGDGRDRVRAGAIRSPGIARGVRGGRGPGVLGHVVAKVRARAHGDDARGDDHGSRLHGGGGDPDGARSALSSAIRWLTAPSPVAPIAAAQRPGGPG